MPLVLRGPPVQGPRSLVPALEGGEEVKPVDMVHFARQCAGEKCVRVVESGDCLSATVASLLELPLSEVPFFALARDGCWPWLDSWLAARGWLLRPRKRAELPSGPVLACGRSPRGFYHAVVWEGGPSGRIVHDPHPSRVGFGDLEPHEFFILLRAAETCECCGGALSGKTVEGSGPA